jgi:hypothetical protein
MPGEPGFSASTSDQAKVVETYVGIVEHMVQSLRVDRNENHLILGFFGAAVTAFFALAKLAPIQAAAQHDPWLGRAAVASLVLGALGTVLLFFYTRELHRAEIDATEMMPLALTASPADLGEAAKVVCGLRAKYWRVRSHIHSAGYWLLVVSIALFLFFAARLLLSAPEPPAHANYPPTAAANP